jgi:hypothetical protein
MKSIKSPVFKALLAKRRQVQESKQTKARRRKSKLSKKELDRQLHQD